MCWICGKAVTPETLKKDDHGSSVHARCHAAKLALASASMRTPEIAPSIKLKPVNPLFRRQNTIAFPQLLKTGSD
jgi:hypothetical protein